MLKENPRISGSISKTEKRHDNRTPDTGEQKYGERGNSGRGKTKVAISVAQMKQKLMTFEELFNEATPEERKDLLRLHINYLIYTPDGIQLALFGSSNEADRPKVQRDDTIGRGERI